MSETEDHPNVDSPDHDVELISKSTMHTRRFGPHPAILIAVGVVMMALVFSLGTALGYGLGRTNAVAAAPDPVPQPTMGGARGALYPAFDLYWEAMDLLYRDYYGTLPSEETVTYAAINGVLDLIDDPYTAFLTPEDADAFRSTIDGEFEGIGARVGWDQEADTLLIVDVFENQPAWEAGLRRHDLVLAVDGESVMGTSQGEAIRLIRGPAETEVTLTVQRPEVNIPFDLVVIRSHIAIPTITTKQLGENGELFYLHLATFNDNSATLVREAVRNALAHEPEGMILDLRGNSGGLLREAVKVVNVFVEDELVLLERFSDGRTEPYRTSTSAVTEMLPLVVLVDESSASASEIVAGALQDSGRAQLVGATTFGKGSVQLPHTLSDGSILRVTIARWYTPLDRSIEGRGLNPDVAVAFSEAEREAGDDPQLDAALRSLQTQIAINMQ